MASKSVYGASAREICELFADYLEGDSDRPALALYAHADGLGYGARDAIVKSLAVFGYESDACTFARCGELDPQALFLLVEGIDPLFVIATDRDAVALLCKAYRQDFALDAPVRVAGRSGVAFSDLEGLMVSPELKQRAWKLFKSLR